jgi:ectoine hydroxylase-related dioxygenase (phytanoyl-CoA dioxygenase family)
MSKTVDIERLAREYAERGYVVVEDYLARDVVDACRAECEDVLRCVSSAFAKTRAEGDRAMAWTDVCSVRA